MKSEREFANSSSSPLQKQNLRQRFSSASASPRSSWLLTRLVFFRSRRAYQRVRPRLDRRRKFAQVVADLPQIVEQLVDIFRIYVQRLIKVRRKTRRVRQRLPQLKDGRMHVLAIVPNQRIDVIERLIRCRRSLPQIVDQRLQLLCSLIDVCERAL